MGQSSCVRLTFNNSNAPMLARMTIPIAHQLNGMPRKTSPVTIAIVRPVERLEPAPLSFNPGASGRLQVLKCRGDHFRDACRTSCEQPASIFYVGKDRFMGSLEVAGSRPW